MDRKRIQREDLHAAEQRRNNLEAGILGGGADKGDRAVLDIRQQEVLLRFIEAVYLIKEEHDAIRPGIGIGRGEHAKLAVVGCCASGDRFDDAPQLRLAG